MAKDYYKILGVDKNATPDEIKKAYRTQVKKCHPDLHPGDNAAAEKFKELNEAHEVLSDDKKRKNYDTYGDPNGGMGGFGGMNMQNLMRQAQKMQEDMAKAQEELESTVVEGVSGGGMVKVSMTCNGDIQNFKLAKEAVDPEDIEMLEDLLLAAIKDASSKAKEIKDSKMGGFGNLGGLM